MRLREGPLNRSLVPDGPPSSPEALGRQQEFVPRMGPSLMQCRDARNRGAWRRQALKALGHLQRAWRGRNVRVHHWEPPAGQVRRLCGE